MISKKKKLQIGLDIGVTSVGWSLLETSGNDVKILNTGVRLFSDVADPKTGKLNNEKRRSKRSARRTISRRKNRKQTVIKLLVEYGLLENIKDAEQYISRIDITKFGYDIPAQLKCEGLNGKFKELYKEKLIFCLYNYVSHRGYSFEEYNEESTSKKINSKASQISQEISLLTKSNKYPSEMIVDFYTKYKYYKNSGIQNVHTEQWKKEIKMFCNQQELNKEFIDKYLKLFDSYDYSIGPNVKMFNDPLKAVSNPSPYGLYNPKNPDVFYNTLWEKTTGHCSFYTEEYRGAKGSVIAEIFNFLNDLSNFYLDGNIENKLSPIQRQEIISNIKKIPQKGLTLATVLKPIINNKEELNKITSSLKCGLKLKTNTNTDISTPVISSCSNYCKILNYLDDNKLISIDNTFNFIDIELINKLNKISDIYFKFKSKEQIEKNLDIFFKKNFGASVDFSNDNIPKLTNVSQTHSLSYKAMNEYINYWINCSDDKVYNWQQYQLNESKKKDLYLNQQTNNKKYISKEFVKDLIISPSTKRAFNQTINVLNSIIKNYSDEYDFEHITIELARDKNTAAERERIKKINNKNETIIEKIIENNDIFKGKELSNTAKLKLKLWDEQNRCDIYTGDYIKPEELLNGNLLDIDHIVPISINNDDSFANKVLCFKLNNKEKSNRTPYEWLSSKGKFDEFKTRVLNNEKISKNKKDILLNTDVMSITSGFIGRQLVDTRYACVAVKDTLVDFFKNNEYYSNKPIINNIRGSVTSLFRKVLNAPLLEKDRKEYKHHAVDASIIAYLGSDSSLEKRMSFAECYFYERFFEYQNNGERIIVEKSTGEVIDFGDSKYLDLNNNQKLKSFKNELDKRINENKFHFSRMIQTKNNVELSNETIYSMRWDENPDSQKQVNGKQITNLNLLTTKLDKLQNYFGNNAKQQDLESLICYKEDKKLYNDLNSIFNSYYSDKENPFISYMLDKHPEFSKAEINFIELDEFRKVSKLKIIGDSKNNQNVILLKKHNKNKDSLNIPILENLNTISTRIYKNNLNKYIAIPINILVCRYNQKNKKLEIDNEKLNNLLLKNNVSNSKKYVELKYGTTLIHLPTNIIYYSLGSTSNGYMELKALDRTLEKRKPPVILNTILKEYRICDIPITNGKIKIRDWNL